ncbi:MAG: flavin reductase family protein [Lautropia sp.]
MNDPGHDARQLRRALGAFATGVTVITTLDPSGRRFGLTANSFNSVSLDPALILWSLSNQAPSYPAFKAASRFVVNILAEDQAHLSRRFASRADDKFAGVEVVDGIDGVPVIVGCAATLQCSTFRTVPGGDHTVFFGRVDAFHHTDALPLVFGRGEYLRTAPLGAGAAGGAATVASAA